MKKPEFKNIFKNKVRMCSASAATITLAAHLLLIMFAGSWIIFKHVLKQNAQLTAVTENRPKLERRKLQSPERVEQLQKRALSSRIVSKKISFSNPEFVLPDTGEVGALKTQKSGLPGFDASRALRNLSRSSGVRPSYIDFFGIRAESEKAVFLIDASAAMLGDSTGGFLTYDYIKSEMTRIASELKPSMLFNLIFYDRQRVYMFRSQLVPGSRENIKAFSEWAQKINKDPAHSGLAEDQDNYQRPAPYSTAVGSDCTDWLQALQAALEQHADTVFLLCAEWGKHSIGPEKRRLLRDFSLWELLSGSGQASVRGSPVLLDDRKLRDDLLKQAVETIQKDEELRKKAGLAAEFLHDIPEYIQYPADQILDHAETVSRIQYSAAQLTLPQMNVVRLVPEGVTGKSDEFTIHMRDLVRSYKGELVFFSGEEAARRQREAARSETTPAEEEEVLISKTVERAEIPASNVKFIDAAATGSKIAFVLDASAGMLSAETGGTNTYEWIKRQLMKAVSELQPGTLFNVVVYDQKQVALFRSQMKSESTGLSDWLAGINRDAARPGLRPEQSNYTPAQVYETAIGADVQSLPYALQAAMEERADTILVVSTGMGPQPVSLAKAARLLDFSIWNALGGSSGSPEDADEEGNPVTGTGSGASSGGQLRALQQDRKMYTSLLKQTLDRIAAEKKARQDAGLPPGFVPDILNSIEYPRGQVLTHIATVCGVNYTSQELPLPGIHFFCLQEPGKKPERETMRDLSGLTRPYNGTIQIFDNTSATR